MARGFQILVLVGLLFTWFSQAIANDSSAFVAVGGLTLTQSDAISLDSEELYISREEVRVDYKFTNTSKQDIKTLVAFPLPDTPMIDVDDMSAQTDMQSDLKFKTLVDGVAVDYAVVVQAMLNEKDVSARLNALGVPLHAVKNMEDFNAKIIALLGTDRDALIKDGLIVDQSGGEQKFFAANWVLRTSVTRQQVFAAGKSVSVSHRYVPVAGGSVGGNWSPEMRPSNDWFKSQSKLYCVEDSWLKSLDKQVAKRRTQNNPSPYAEVWLSYVLKSGANWKGPIKDFRLVVDKGKPDSLVSFCGQGVKKISPTQFEMRKKNFEPKADLNVLIVDWWTAGE